MSLIFTTTAAAPAVYANIREHERLSNAVGDETVVPIIFLSDSPDSYRPRGLFGDRGVRGWGEFEGVSFNPRPVFATKVVRGFDGVDDIIKPWECVNWDQCSTLEAIRDQRQTICVFKETIGCVVGLIGKRNGEKTWEK